MKLKARIYRPAKTAMSSGRRKTRQWVYEFAPAIKNAPEPLMGWNSGGTLQQVRLEFDTKEAAIAYAKSKGVPFEVEVPHERRRQLLPDQPLGSVELDGASVDPQS